MTDIKEAAPRIAFVTLGCAKNEVDSQEMAARLVRAGYRITHDPEAAELVIVNTCSFIQAATEESLDAFFSIAGLQNVLEGDTKIVMAGCMPARYGDELASELTEASAFVPCSREDDIVEIVGELLPGQLPLAPALEADGTIGANEYALTTAGDSTLVAYVKISDGCNRMCSYCTIPYIRGRYHSFSRDDIAADVAYKVSRGVREITLIAQDTGRWGSDLPDEGDLASLMSYLAERFPETWFRVMYIQPEGITDALLEAIASHDNICSYLDIPFQHAAKPVLRAMNRRGTGEEYLKLVEHIRETVPGITLRTTLIAGFPGETEEQFEQLLDFVEEAEFDYVGVFPYSREEGTRAAELDDQIDEDVKQERAQEVRDVADAISHARIAERVGSRMPVLVLGREEDGQLFGRAQCQAPEVDGVTYLDAGEPGEIRELVITDTLAYEMEGDGGDGELLSEALDTCE